MKHQLTNRVKLLHKVAIFSEGQVLLLKRSPNSPSRPNCWDLPGGNSEWPKAGESDFDYHQKDITRELQEETHLSIETTHFSHQNLVYFRTYYDADKDIYTIICGWHLSLDTLPKIILSHEHTQFKWAQLTNLDSYNVGGQAGEFIKDIIRSSSIYTEHAPPSDYELK